MELFLINYPQEQILGGKKNIRSQYYSKTDRERNDMM